MIDEKRAVKVFTYSVQVNWQRWMNVSFRDEFTIVLFLKKQQQTVPLKSTFDTFGNLLFGCLQGEGEHSASVGVFVISSDCFHCANLEKIQRS